MRLPRLAAWLALVALVALPARAACPPPELLLGGVRNANRVQVEQLGSDATRIDTPLAHAPGRTLGYEVHGLFRVSGEVALAFQRTFGTRDSYECSGAREPFEVPAPLALGFQFASRRSTMAVVLHLPECAVELQLEGGVHARVYLSATGRRRWQEAIRLLARETRTSPEEFYEQMQPPVRVEPAPGALPDSAGPPRDEVPAPR